MIIARPTLMAAAALSLALLAGCGGGDDATRKPTAAGSSLPRSTESVTLDRAQFSTRIDNPYRPMTPGTRWVYRETEPDGTELRVVVTVTARTRRIANGVTARVVSDVVTENGEPAEVIDDWYAQDGDGNVWYLGEQTKEYENGRVKTTAGSFEAGVDGAQPGIAMPAAPKPGPAYRHGYYKGEAEDRASIFSLGERVEVPAGSFQDVVMTKHLNALQPELLEHKFHARGVGPVLAIGVSGGNGREELVSYRRGR